MKEYNRARKPLYVIGLLALFFLCACSPKRPFVRPRVQLANLAVKDISLSHINYSATINVYNPNLDDLSINFIEYSIFLNKLKFMDGAEQLDIVIKPHERKDVPITLSGSLFNILQLLSIISKEPKIEFILKGSISGNARGGQDFKLPFEEKGQISFDQLNPGIPLR